MAVCKIIVCTTTDGVKNKIVRMGKIEECEDGIGLYYREENADVSLFITDKRAEIRREGEYTLHLPLREGECSKGGLGIGGSQGEVEISTHCVKLMRTAEKIDILLKYALLFGEEKQKMQLEITAMRRVEK